MSKSWSILSHIVIHVVIQKDEHLAIYLLPLSDIKNNRIFIVCPHHSRLCQDDIFLFIFLLNISSVDIFAIHHFLIYRIQRYMFHSAVCIISM